MPVVTTVPSGASVTPETVCDADVPKGRVCCQARPFAETNAVSVRPVRPVTAAPSGPPFARPTVNPLAAPRVAVNVQPTPFGE